MMLSVELESLQVMNDSEMFVCKDSIDMNEIENGLYNAVNVAISPNNQVFQRLQLPKISDGL